MTSEYSLRDLILSVGTHKSQRPLSPLEVADGLAALINNVGYDEALGNLSLDISTARRFLRLRELAPDIGQLVDWGRRPGAISFSAAAEMVRLAPASQSQVAKACLEYSLTKEEVRQVVQLVLRRGDDVESAVQSVLRMRPSVVTIHVTLCAVQERIGTELARVGQRIRDELLVEAVASVSIGVKLTAGRLTSRNFSVSSLSPVPDGDVTALEDGVNRWLANSIHRYV